MQAQPHRKGAARGYVAALRAAQKGGPANMAHPSTPQRMATRKKRKRKRKDSNPLYKILGVRKNL